MSDNVKDPKELLMEGETGDSARIRAMEQEKQAAINEEIVEATSVKGQYSASQIQVLEGLEAVRIEHSPRRGGAGQGQDGQDPQ